MNIYDAPEAYEKVISQNERDRGFQLAMAALQSQHDKEYFEMQVDAENGRSLSSFIWEMIT